MVMPASGRDMPVRSDLPLWSEAGAGVWPQPTIVDKHPGHGSPIMLGDWKVTDLACAKGAAQGNPDDCVTWFRIAIFGADDGGFRVTRSLTRAALDGGRDEPAIADPLPIDRKERDFRIVVLQTGFRSSEYEFLTTRDHGTIKHFGVFRSDCVDKNAKGGRRKDIEIRHSSLKTVFRTEYCAVRSATAMRGLAQAAAGKSPSATMEWVESPGSGQQAVTAGKP
jgi:hypothetical protein